MLPAAGSRYNMRMPTKLSAPAFAHTCATLRERYADEIRLTTLAADVGLSPWQFSRSFHATAGVTFARYLVRIRVDSAMTMMANSNRPLVDIALACGFGDQPHFTRQFARTAGMTPGRWRNALMHREIERVA